MKNFFTLTLCFLTLSITAQEPLTYPYNPDANSDQFVAVSDVLETIATYGDQFFPEEIMVGDTTLSNWIQILNQTLANQQAVIDSLQASLASQDTQLDSTMIADMIAAAGGLGGGALLSNPKYPQGLIGETISVIMTSENNYSYTVPEGKNLYVYAMNYGPGGGPTQSLYIDDIYYGPVAELGGGFTLFSSGEVISIGDETNDLDFIGFIGFLIDEGPIASINVIFDENNTNWTVPFGKYFMLQRLITEINGSDQILLDDENFCQNNDPGCKWIQSLVNRAFIEAGSVYSMLFIEHPEGVMNMRGYIVDEDYFGGGGGSEEVGEEGSGGGELGPCEGELTVNYHGYDYQLVEIGDQCWYKENARYLPTINSTEEYNYLFPTFHVNNFYGNDIEEAKASYMYKTYGVYYNFPAIEEWDICPLEWRVPSIDDWNQFKEYINQSSDGLHIMEEYLNYSGFSGRFGGWHGADSFHGTETSALWWSTSPVDNSFYSPQVTNSGLSLNTNTTNTSYLGANIRCIKD